MATARCYTKSGSVEKYESNLWSLDSSVSAIITGPDSSGNYTVTPPSGYSDSNTQTKFYCTTIYNGVKKTFYFKVDDIAINVYIEVDGYSYNGVVAFNCTVSGGSEYDTSPNKEIINNILKNNSIYLSWEVVTRNGPFGNYKTRLTSVGSLILNTWSYYDNSNYYYISSKYCQPSSGTYNGKKWKINIGEGT